MAPRPFMLPKMQMTAQGPRMVGKRYVAPQNFQLNQQNTNTETSGWATLDSDSDEEKEKEKKEEKKEEPKKKAKKRKIYLNQAALDHIHGKTSLEYGKVGIVGDLPQMPMFEKKKATYMTFDPTWCSNSVTFQNLFPGSQRAKEHFQRTYIIELVYKKVIRM